jgi:hypothetical protein
MRIVVSLLLMCIACVPTFATDRTNEVAACYRQLEGLEEDAKGSNESLQLLKKRGTKEGVCCLRKSRSFWNVGDTFIGS